MPAGKTSAGAVVGGVRCGQNGKKGRFHLRKDKNRGSF